MGVARVLDWDGTIIDESKGTLLERFLYDFYEKQVGAEKLSFALRAYLVKAYRRSAVALGRVFEKEITGETTTLEVLELLVLKNSKIPFSFMVEKAKEYAKEVKGEYIAAIKNCNEPIYIVSAEPTQLINSILEELGVSDKIKGVYGTKFEVEDGIITGFDRYHLYAGTRGKYIGMERITTNGYSKILAIGNSSADKGLFEMHKEKVSPFTLNGASKNLIEYVLKNNGCVVTDLEDFFKFDASA